MNDNDTNNSENTSSQNSENTEQTTTASQRAELNPAIPEGSFVMKVKAFNASDGKEGDLEYKIKDQNTWEMNGTFEGDNIRMIRSGEEVYIYDSSSDSWQAFPITAQNFDAQDPGSYNFTQDEYQEFINKADNIGERDCPAGTCDVYEVKDQVVNDLENVKVAQVYIDKSSGAPSKFYYEETTGNTVDAEFQYGVDVNVEVPTNVNRIEIPTNIPGVN